MSAPGASPQSAGAGTTRFPPLRSPGEIALPVSKRVLLPTSNPPTVRAAVTKALESGGFTPVADPPVARGDGGELSVHEGLEPHFGERRVRRTATSSSTRASMSVLIASGALLGLLDAFVVGSAILLIPWVGVGVGAAGFIWLRYGRTYQSEVIAVVPVSTTAGSDDPGGPANPPGLLWSVGRVRSVGYAGSRTTVGVPDCPVSLIDTLTAVVRRFDSELGEFPSVAAP